MTGGRALRVVEEATRLLARERDLLLEGRFADLARAAAVREEQVQRLERLDAAAAQALGPQLETLREAASRNAALLKAAIEGAASARRRLAAIAEGPAALHGYDASGAPVEHRGAPRPVGRRA